MAGFFFFRTSLAHDDVDRYNNAWAVGLFLLLALLSLLMPLSPTLSDSMKSHSIATQTPSQSPQQPSSSLPTFKADCWTPKELTNPQVNYANKYCADVANGMMKGVKATGRTLYELTDTAIDVDQLNLTSIAVSRESYFKGIEVQKAQQEKNEKVRKNTQELVDFRTPVILFLMALFLKLPYILWSLMSNMMTSCINVDGALDSCVESRNLDTAGQKQIHEETASAVAESVNESRNTASFLYLFLKVLMVLVVLGETFFVSKYVVPDIQAMGVDFVENPLSAKFVSGIDKHQGEGNVTDAKHETTTAAPAAASDAAEATDGDAVGLLDYPNNILRCGFKIRHFKTTQKFIFQCVFTRVEDSAAETKDSSGTIPPSSPTPLIASASGTIESTLLLYQALFTVVLAFLAVLVVANVVNAVSWFLRLFVGSYATSMGLPSDAARDAVLLVHMAWLNAGPRVARGLAGSPAWAKQGGQGEPEEQPMLETTP